VDDSAAIGAVLRSLVAKIAHEMRGDNLGARTVTVKLKDSDFTTRLASRTVEEPIESDRAIADIAVGLLQKLRAARRSSARLVGVSLGNFKPARDAEQLGLFGAPAAVERAQDRAVSRAMDRVRERFGSEAIRTGSVTPTR
jgi:DNA polymerase IV